MKKNQLLLLQQLLRKKLKKKNPRLKIFALTRLKDLRS